MKNGIEKGCLALNPKAFFIQKIVVSIRSGMIRYNLRRYGGDFYLIKLSKLRCL